MYSKILLTLDGSDVARQAIPHTATVAKATGAAVVVMQVVDSEAQLIMQASGATIEPMPMGAVSAEIAHEAVVAQREAAQRSLEAARAELAAGGISNVTVEIREGAPGTAIVDAVEELGCDLVVMATHGRSGIKRAILGSVADHVIRHAERAAVLLVRATE